VKGPDTAAAPEELPVSPAKKKLDWPRCETARHSKRRRTPITVGDYRRQSRMQESRSECVLSVDASSLQQLLALAKQENVTLTADEKRS